MWHLDSCERSWTLRWRMCDYWGLAVHRPADHVLAIRRRSQSGGDVGALTLADTFFIQRRRLCQGRECSLQPTGGDEGREESLPQLAARQGGGGQAARYARANMS